MRLCVLIVLQSASHNALLPHQYEQIFQVFPQDLPLRIRVTRRISCISLQCLRCAAAACRCFSLAHVYAALHVTIFWAFRVLLLSLSLLLDTAHHRTLLCYTPKILLLPHGEVREGPIAVYSIFMARPFARTRAPALL